MRFPGFTDGWKLSKLGDECEIQMCKRILAQQTTPKGGVPFFKIGTIGGQPDAYISYELFNLFKEKYNYPQKGEILISCAGTVGRCVRFDGNPAYFQDSNIVWPRNTQCAYTNDFLFYILSNQNWKHLNTTTIVRIYNDDLRSLKIHYPSIEEQKKITRLLVLIDERIATQNKIIDNLQSLIKGLAKTLTHQKAPNTRISDCLECHTSTLQEGTLNENGQYPVYGASGIAGFLDNFRCYEDSILIIKDGSGAGTVSYATGEYSVIGTLNYLTAKSEYLLKYLYFSLMSLNFEPFKTGMAIPHIYFKDYGQAKIYCPSIEEQERIASALTIIEDKLKIESELLNSLDLEKQYLLNNMFI